MIHVGEYLFNPRYIRYVTLDIDEDENDYFLRVELTDGDHVKFTFDDKKEADKVFKFIKRKTGGES